MSKVTGFTYQCCIRKWSSMQYVGVYFCVDLGARRISSYTHPHLKTKKNYIFPIKNSDSKFGFNSIKLFLRNSIRTIIWPGFCLHSLIYPIMEQVNGSIFHGHGFRHVNYGKFFWCKGDWDLKWLVNQETFLVDGGMYPPQSPKNSTNFVEIFKFL